MSGTGDYQLLHNTLIVAALLFAVGTVGFLTQRNRAGLVIALCILIQSSLTVLIGFCTFHGISETGGNAAIIVLVGASCAGILFALALRSRRPVSSPPRQRASTRSPSAETVLRDERAETASREESDKNQHDLAGGADG